MKQKRIGSSIIVVLVMIYLLIPLAVTIIYSCLSSGQILSPEAFPFLPMRRFSRIKSFS